MVWDVSGRRMALRESARPNASRAEPRQQLLQTGSTIFNDRAARQNLPRGDARRTDTGLELLLPGDGDTDYALYFRLLKELGYRGWVAAEVTSMIWREPGYDPAVAARRAYANIAPAWKVAGLDRKSRT